jgi:hypothetical protein
MPHVRSPRQATLRRLVFKVPVRFESVLECAPFTELYLHCVWATWDRLPLITPEVELDLYTGSQENIEFIAEHSCESNYPGRFLSTAQNARSVNSLILRDSMSLQACRPL